MAPFNTARTGGKNRMRTMVWRACIHSYSCVSRVSSCSHSSSLSYKSLPSIVVYVHVRSPLYSLSARVPHAHAHVSSIQVYCHPNAACMCDPTELTRPIPVHLIFASPKSHVLRPPSFRSQTQPLDSQSLLPRTTHHPLHHGREILNNEMLRIVAVITTMVANQIMCQLMTQHNPPIHQCLRSRLCQRTGVGRLYSGEMKLREEAEVGEHGAGPVEGDCGAGRVVEQVQG